jgi:hypothetical protein
MHLKIEETFMVVNSVKILWETLKSAYNLQFKLNISLIGEDIVTISSQECRNVDDYTLQINWKDYKFNLNTESQTTDTKIADLEPKSQGSTQYK